MFAKRHHPNSPYYDTKRADKIEEVAVPIYRDLMGEVLRNPRKIEEALTEQADDKLMESARIMFPDRTFGMPGDVCLHIGELSAGETLALVHNPVIKKIVEDYWDNVVMTKALEEAEMAVDEA